ncbi:MAG: V-type ATP synthase subunit D [Acidilobaceae archaeon]
MTTSLQYRLPRATKIELLRLKKRLRLAEKLRDLLHDKMIVLLQELYATALRASNLRRKLNELLLEVYVGFTEAYATRGRATLEATALGVSEPKVKVMTRSSMGVLLPVVEVDIEDGHSYPVELHILNARRKEVIETLLELSESEKALEILATEISRTKRKVEALDKVLIPRLKSLIRSLEMKFEEMEREERVRSIKVKRILEVRHGGI